GTTIWSDTGNLALNDGAVFNNLGGAVFDVQNDQYLQTTLIGTPGTFLNAGTFRKSSTGITSVGLGGITFSNTGTLDLQTGQLQVSTNGSLTLDPESIVTGMGSLRVSGGTVAVNSPVTGANVELLSGTLSVNEDLAASLTLRGGTLIGTANLTIPSSMEWTGGSLGGTGRTIIGPGATLNIPSGALEYAGRPLDMKAQGSAI